MKLTARHLTGSRAGEEQIFDSNEVTIGRNPSNAIMFDPEKDLVVSGKHALLAFDQDRWMVRDLGSSNGTFVDGNKITERTLHPGQIVQFGKNGPKVQFFFEAQDAVAGTVVEPLEDLSSPAREGRTVIMMMPQEGAAPAGALPSYLAPAAGKKKGKGLLLVAAAAVMLLLFGVVALALLVRSSNLKKRKQLAAQKQAAVISPAELQRQKEEADRLNAEIAKKQEDIARTEQTLQQTQDQSGSTSESEDMKRQLAESQALLEQMTRQLQEKNDQIAEGQSRPSAGQRSQPPFVPPASMSKKTATQPSKVPMIGQTVQGPGPTKGTPSITTSVAATIAPPAAPLFTGKKLKKKVLITSLPPEIPPANLPTSTARDLVNLLNTALISTGDYVAGPKGQASVSVMVTNYRADAKKSLDTKKTADSAKKLGRLLGQSVPSNPVDVRSVAYDAAMSVRVRLYDPSGRLITEVEPSSESSDRKSKVGLGGVSFHDVALSDTAVGDVARKVIGETIDTLRNGLAGLDWSTTVESQSKERIKFLIGRNSNVEPGDVFEIMDGKKAVARARVINVTETGSEAELTTPLQLKLSGKPARYIGSENQGSSSRSERFVTVRIKTSAFDGPGNSFREIRPLRIGIRLTFHYSVGPWARVTHGGSTFWVPMAKVQITS